VSIVIQAAQETKAGGSQVREASLGSIFKKKKSKRAKDIVVECLSMYKALGLIPSHTYDKGLISKTYEELDKQNPIKNGKKSLSTQEDIHTANRDMKNVQYEKDNKCWTSARCWWECKSL
jgi:hypothetical protein